MKSIAQFDIQKIITENPFHDSVIEQPSDESPQWLDIETDNDITIKKIELSKGIFIDHENLSLLVSEKDIIRTWPTQNWSLLMIDQTERFAIFEAIDSYHMSILDLESAEWKTDHDGHMLYFSDDGKIIIDNFHSILHACIDP